MSAEDLEIRIGRNSVCIVLTLNETSILCIVQNDVPKNTEQRVMVKVGNIMVDVGVIVVIEKEKLNMLILYICLVAVAASIGVIFVLLIIWRRKTFKMHRRLPKKLDKLETIQMPFLAKCREEHLLQKKGEKYILPKNQEPPKDSSVAKLIFGLHVRGSTKYDQERNRKYALLLLLSTYLPMDMADMKNDLVAAVCHYRDVKQFVFNIVLPTEFYEDCKYLKQNMSQSRDKLRRTQNAMNTLELLCQNKFFLLAVIQTLEKQRRFHLNEKASVASLISMLLLERMDDFADIMCILLNEHIEKNVVYKKSLKTLFQRSDTITDKMLENWLAISSYSYIKTLLVTVNDNDFACKVLDCDTITQVKSKCLGYVYNTTPASQIPKPDNVDLEWEQDRSDKLLLDDDDVTTETDGRWRRLNTLQHYNVTSESKMELRLREFRDPVNNVEISDDMTKTDSSRPHPVAANNVLVVLQDDDPENSNFYQDSEGQGLLDSWHNDLVQDNEGQGQIEPCHRDSIQDKAGQCPLEPRCGNQSQINEGQGQMDFRRKDSIRNHEGQVQRKSCHNDHIQKNEGQCLIKPWHLIKPEDKSNIKPSDEISELLQQTKGTLTEYMESFFQVILSTKSLPVTVKYMYRFLDAKALEFGQDSDVANIWKSNCYPLRFLAALVKQPELFFDIDKPDYASNCLDVIAEVFNETFGTSAQKIGKNSPSHLFAKEINNYRREVERYYNEVTADSEITQADLQDEMKKISGEQNKNLEYDKLTILQDLFEHIKKYKDDVILELSENQDTCRLQLDKQLKVLIDDFNAA